MGVKALASKLRNNNFPCLHGEMTACNNSPHKARQRACFIIPNEFHSHQLNALGRFAKAS